MEDDEREQLGQLPDFSGRSPPGTGVDASRSDSSTSPSASSPRTGTITSSVSSLNSIPTRPADSEATGYFQGLFSGERLKARSNQLVEPFQMKYEGNWPAKKHLCNIGSHPIVKVYDQSLRIPVREAVASLEWWRIDIVRIGFSDREIENPVFILITVNDESVSYEAGQKAVDACRGLLIQLGLTDVHVLMKTGKPDFGSSDIAGFSTAFDTDVPLPREPYATYPRLGESLGPRNRGAHHAKGDTAASSSRSFQPVYEMDQPSTQDHRALIKHCEYLQEEARFQIRRIEQWKSDAEGGKKRPPPAHVLDQLATFDSHLLELQERKAAAHSFGGTNGRLFGEVFYAPALSINVKHDNLNDWALIRLHPDRFARSPKNLLPPLTEKCRTTFNWKLEVEDRIFPNDLEQPLMNTVSFAQAMKATTNDTDGFPTFRVVKHGRTSGWTAGRMNELRSDCVRERGSLPTTELCIAGIKGKPFSHPGDSGSPVMDGRGHLMGILNRGGLSTGQDLTYVMPIEWLVEDVETSLK
ncbi:MAG: hypothetical protein M1825_004102, partial [Sarcosagium campestre]